ncbi:MAG: CPBP family intramembrane metalloprotease [Defluviitaleaceae bacterium]|nr:CPBP family intramembrane metalloprotease [Defluviitaleaceae bacterium]
MDTPSKANRFFFFVLLHSLLVAEVFALINFRLLLPNDIYLPLWAILFIGQFFTFFVPCAIVAVKYRGKLGELFPMRAMGAANWLMIIGMMLAIQPPIMMLALATSQIFGNPIGDIVAEINIQGNLLLTIGVVAVVPSVFEEIALRGVIFAGYRKTKLFTAAMINGLLFGIIHFSLQQFAYAFILGVIFCYFVYYTKSLISAILAHFVLNGTQASLSFWAVGAESAMQEAMEYYGYAPYFEFSEALGLVIFGILAIICLGLFVLIFIKFKRYNYSRNLNADIVSAIVIDPADSGEYIDIQTLEIPGTPKVATGFLWGSIGAYIAIMALLQIAMRIL